MPKKPYKNRKNGVAEIEARRSQVSLMYLSGLSQMEIANKLNVVQQTVCGDIKALRERWQETAELNTDEHIREELQRLMTLYRDCREDYQKSKMRVVGKGKNRQVVYDGKGDVKYITEARNILAQMEKLMGLTGPDTKININNNMGVQSINWTEMYESAECLFPDPVNDAIDNLLVAPEPPENNPHTSNGHINRLLPPSSNGNSTGGDPHTN